MNKKHMKKRLLIFAAAILMIITTVTVHYKTEVRSEAAGIKTQRNKEKNNRCHPCIQSGQLSVCYWKSSCCRSRERSGL